jgi:ABC-type lipoprotein release transport system permease subunit
MVRRRHRRKTSRRRLITAIVVAGLAVGIGALAAGTVLPGSVLGVST